MKGHRSNSSSSPQLGHSLWIAGLVAVVLGGLIFWSRRPPERQRSPLAFPPLEIDRAELKRQRADRYGEARKTIRGTDQLSRLHEVVRRANERQFTSHPKSNDEEETKTRRELRANIKQASHDVITLTGYDGYIASGEPIFEACRGGLERLLEAIRSGRISLERARTRPDAERFEAYRRNCGQLLPRLLELGLVDDGGRWASPPDRSREILEILQRYRWAFNISNSRRPLLQLTPYERELLFKYRIRNAEGFEIGDRRRFIEQIASDPGLLPEYDVHLARARLAYESNGPQAAREALKRGIEAGDGDIERYRRLLEWLNSRSSRQSSKHG
jgi:hypothetical protein